MGNTLDRARFLKVLALAESDVDGEALAAIRKAAAMARAAGLSLGEAVEGVAFPDTLPADMLEAELILYRDRIAALERELAEAVEDRDGRRRAYRDGLAAGRAAAADRVRAVEVELEAFREGMDWPALADRYHSGHRRGARGEYAKGLLYRASVGRLSADDQAELRRFATASDRKRKRAAA
ncbi:hypothetical protein [Caenispirillum salinarum]|uniref:hypothetical protein n=1 Tax=Caenispirillum salinarum TaxID=859058 RepID=UPI00384E717F